jgi:hypothetical protein
MSQFSAEVTQFTESLRSGNVEVYNEFSLQHEFGFFLRRGTPNLKVQFERNVGYFFPSKHPFSKKEIDISIFSSDKKCLQHAVELKYPRNGQYPEQMFSFCRDVAFAEELVRAGFSSAAFMVFADDRLFYQGASEGIYGFFRGSQPLHGCVKKPTGSKDEEVHIAGTYVVHWMPITGSLKYALIEVGEPK